MRLDRCANRLTAWDTITTRLQKQSALYAKCCNAWRYWTMPKPNFGDMLTPEDNAPAPTMDSTYPLNLPDVDPAVKALVASGTATMTSTGLTIHRELSEDDWKALYVGIRRLKQSFSWIIGDWMLYGADRDYIKTYEDMAELTGLKETTIKNYAYVCRNVNPSLRSDELSFAHFQVIAAQPEEDKAGWIHRAIDEE